MAVRDKFPVRFHINVDLVELRQPREGETPAEMAARLMTEEETIGILQRALNRGIVGLSAVLTTTEDLASFEQSMQVLLGGKAFLEDPSNGTRRERPVRK